MHGIAPNGGRCREGPSIDWHRRNESGTPAVYKVRALPFRPPSRVAHKRDEGHFTGLKEMGIPFFLLTPSMMC